MSKDYSPIDWKTAMLESIGRGDLAKADNRQLLALPIDSFRLSKVTLEALKNQGISTVGDLTSKKTTDFNSMKGIGRKFKREIEDIVHGLDLEFADEKKKSGTYIEKTNLSQKIQLRLRKHGIETVEELTALSEEELQGGKIGKDLGKKETINLLTWLELNGYSLRNELNEAIGVLRENVQKRNGKRSDFEQASKVLEVEARRIVNKSAELSSEEVARLSKLVMENSDLFRQVGVLEEMNKALYRNGDRNLDTDDKNR